MRVYPVSISGVYVRRVPRILHRKCDLASLSLSASGSDLMAKGVRRNSSVIKLITSAFIHNTDDYIVVDSEWSSSCRSDLVPEPKSLSLVLSSFLLEIRIEVR